MQEHSNSLWKLILTLPCDGLMAFPLSELPYPNQRFKNVSMPCIGLISFLQGQNMKNNMLNKLCQCPVSGLYHFYLCKSHRKWTYKSGVNALYRAYIISTGIIVLQNYQKLIRVNALYRAYIISTINWQISGSVKGSVNALYRAYIISTLRKQK